MDDSPTGPHAPVCSSTAGGGRASVGGQSVLPSLVTGHTSESENTASKNRMQVYTCTCMGVCDCVHVGGGGWYGVQVSVCVTCTCMCMGVHHAVSIVCTVHV